MTEELTNVIERAKQLCEWIGQNPHQRGSINGLAAQVQHELSALTQRPAAQTEREAMAEKFEAMHANGDVWISTVAAANLVRASLPAPQQATPALTDSMGMPTSCGKPLCSPDEHHPLCSLHKPAAQDTQQATPEPLTGCNCRWQGDTQVEWCELHLAHKEAIHEWAERAKAAEAKLKAAPEPVQLDVVRQAIEERDAMESRYHELAIELIRLADIIRDCGRLVSKSGNAERIMRDAARVLATPEPVGEDIKAAAGRLMGWPLPQDFAPDGGIRFTPPSFGWPTGTNLLNVIQAEQMLAYVLDGYTRPAAASAVPEDTALLDYLDTLAARPAGSDLHCFGGSVVLYVRTGIGSQVEASGAGTAREAIRAAMLAAAQAKGAKHE